MLTHLVRPPRAMCESGIKTPSLFRAFLAAWAFPAAWSSSELMTASSVAGNRLRLHAGILLPTPPSTPGPPQNSAATPPLPSTCFQLQPSALRGESWCPLAMAGPSRPDYLQPHRAQQPVAARWKAHLLTTMDEIPLSLPANSSAMDIHVWGKPLAASCVTTGSTQRLVFFLSQRRRAGDRDMLPFPITADLRVSTSRATTWSTNCSSRSEPMN